MNILSTFGLNLKEVRLEAKLTQEELAELTNFHRTYIGLLEAGKRNPTLDTLIKLSIALKCDPAILLKGINLNDY